MKYKFFSGFLALAVPALAQAAADSYINDAVIICPPQIPPQVDATNFVNNNYFSINFTSFVFNAQLYKTANTLNFTNRGAMVVNNGFQFDTGPSSTGQRRMAANFDNTGTISASSSANTNPFAFFFFGQPLLPKLLISATNVTMNSGTNIVGRDGLFRVSGKNVNLTRANITMEGFNVATNPISPPPPLPLPECISPGPTNDTGIYDGYWGFGTDLEQADACVNFGMPPVTTPQHLVTSPGNIFPSFRVQRLQLPTAVSYVDETFLNVSSRVVRVVFLNNTNSAIANNVYFRPFSGFLNFANGHTVVEWVSPTTNSATGSVFTNYLYLFDNLNLGFAFPPSVPAGVFFRFCTNFFTTNGLVANLDGLAQQPTYRPQNFTFFERRTSQASLLGLPVSPGTFSFNCLPIFTFSSAYGALFSPTTQIPGNAPGVVITNLPGRTEINADGILDLTRARIAGLNYLLLRATNHFAGSSRASVSVPWSDINLASTNGLLNITNLLAPTVPRLSGEVDLWSGAWSDIEFFGGGFPPLFSEYHVLFVDSRLSPTAPAMVQDLTLRSTNIAGGSDSVFISDILNVRSNLMLETERLTITTNQLPAPTPRGEINLLSSFITWPASTPRLQYFTNNGVFSSLNAVFFGGSRTSPFYTSNFNEPYIAFVNRGVVTTEGSLIWASYFENSGMFNSGSAFGSLALESQTALLTNGFFLAPGGDISITSGVLTNINHVLQTGGKLTLNVTDVLTDTVTNTTTVTVVSNAVPITLTIVSNANSWTAGNGVDLPVKPRLGDLLGTTILDTAPAGAEVRHLWAAEDRDCSPAGFTDNVALGRLILDGGNDSLFTFTGTGVRNALYVDYLELRNFTTNIDFNGNLAGVQIDPNMTIYFAQAVMNGVSVAERLNGANGGFCWASNYAGIYSSTNLFYGGGTNTLNVALVQSANLDSDCDGLVNSDDPEPIFLVATASLPEATNNAAYSAQLQAGGGPPSPHTWALVPGSAALPTGLSLSSDGLISGTPTQAGNFPFTVRVSVTTACGVLTVDRSLTINVSPGVLALSVVLVSQPTPGAMVSWPGIPNSTNYLYFKPSPQASDWLLLTNFGIGSAAPARVSVLDPVAGNVTRFYRVQVSTQH